VCLMPRCVAQHYEKLLRLVCNCAGATEHAPKRYPVDCSKIRNRRRVRYLVRVASHDNFRPLLGLLRSDYARPSCILVIFSRLSRSMDGEAGLA
jgi:hypothetical protein